MHDMRLWFAVVAACAGAGLVPRAAADRSPVVVVGPNMLVSRDGNVPHVELMVVANPKNARNLLGAAMTATRREGGWACRTYASLDGGATWIDNSFAEQTELGGADPQVAFSARGTALFAALVWVRDARGREHTAVHFHRSEDGGLTWVPGADLGYSYDHEQIVVDQSVGAHAGRIYVGTVYGSVDTVGVFRSDDDARTFTGPVDVANGGGKLGLNVSNILLFRDGTLFVPYVTWSRERRTTGPVESRMFFATSPDGGVTFSEPRSIHTQTLFPDDPHAGEFGLPIFGLDASTGPYKDRLYVAWTEFRSGGAGPRLFFSSSADRGAHWTEPRSLDPSAPAGARQFQPALAVNKDGVLGITWFDTRHSKDGSQYDEYFTASLDGGETFLRPVRVSSESSIPMGAGNMVPAPQTFTAQGVMRLALLTPAARWPSGGDYMGLTADRDGAFRPLWADSRTGTFQMYTTAVTVDVSKPASNDASKAVDRTAVKPPSQPTRIETELSDKIEFVFDPASYDMATREVALPVGIRNSTKQTIFPPVRVEVVEFGSGKGNVDREFAPQVLNASNGKTGIGAWFDFSPALGTRQRLEPGDVSGPIVWRMKLAEPMKTPDLHLRVFAQVEQ